MTEQLALEFLDSESENFEQVIRSRACGLVRGLSVSIQSGRVTVTGQSETYYAKQLITQAVLEVADGVDLVNEIEVC